MALPKQKFREVVFQLLYSFDIGDSSEENMIPLLMKELSVSKKSVLQALDKAKQIKEHLFKIDELIIKVCKSYRFERIQTVEKNVLRLAIYEMFYDKDIPQKVAIAEAIRLTKKFSTPESISFVNAILDNIFKQNEKI